MTKKEGRLPKMMKKKLFALIGGSLMSAMFLAGCGTNDDNDPAPEDNNMIEENQDGVNDNNINDNDDGMIENDNPMTDENDDMMDDNDDKK